MKKIEIELLDIQELMLSKARQGMIFVSDVDGVHTSRQEGVCITGRFSERAMASFHLDGIGNQCIPLIPHPDFAKDFPNQEFWLGGAPGEETLEFYKFFTPDGQAILNLKKIGVRVLIVSGRDAAPVRVRFGETKLGAEVHLGVKDKLEYFREAVKLDLGNTIFISDGHQDAPMLRAVRDAGGIAIAPADAEPEAAEAAEVLTVTNGGQGVFAEVANAYLHFLQDNC